MGDNLKQKMLGAVTWSAVDRIGQQAVQFVIGLILARLLSPDDYGLIGMVAVFTALSLAISDGGFNLALIRKQDASEVDYSSVFFFNFLISIVLYSLLFFLTPYISLFFNQPQLTSVGRILFLGIFFNALYLVPFAKLGKAMDYKTIAKVNLTATLVSGTTGVILAVLDFGVWSLVAQQTLYHLFRAIFFYGYVKWFPKLIFSFQAIRSLWKFSIHLLGVSILNVIFNYIYVLILSKFYPKNQVGFYTQANKLNETFAFSFQSILLGSSYSLFSQIQHDKIRLRRVFREIAEKTSLITFPVLIGLMAAAKPFIQVLLTEKWLQSVPYFQLLCLASLFIPLYNLNINVLNTRGMSKLTLRLELFKKCAILVSVFLCFNYGIIAMLWAYAFVCLLSYLVSILFLKKELQHFIRHQVIDFIGGISIGACIGVVLTGLSYIIDNYYLLFFLQLVIATVLYILLIRYFYPDLFKKAFALIQSRLTCGKKGKSS